MKARKTWAVLALVLVMVIGLSGCGRNADATPPDTTSTPPTATAEPNGSAESDESATTDPATTEPSAASGISDEELDEIFQGAVDKVIHGEVSDEDLEELRRLTGETAEDDGNSATNSPGATPTTVEPQGLIVLTVEHADQATISVANFNAQTGSLQTIASWSNPALLNFDQSNAVVYTLPNNTQFNSEREWFDYEYDKLAVTMTRRSDNETHAGWLETDGTFFDVTEALGQQSSDFGDAVKYAARGFTADGLFVFGDGRQTYYVPLDNLTAAAVQTGNGFALGHPTDQAGRPTNRNDYFVTDWLDGNTCLATRWSGNNPTENALIADAGKPAEFLASSKRYNWNMYFSPDGSQVAFMSAPSSGTESPDVFIMAYPDGEPTRVAAHSKFVFTQGIDFYGSRNWDCFLIDWR